MINGVYMKLYWKGYGKIVHGNIVLEWILQGTGFMRYQISSLTTGRILLRKVIN